LRRQLIPPLAPDNQQHVDPPELQLVQDVVQLITLPVSRRGCCNSRAMKFFITAVAGGAGAAGRRAARVMLVLVMFVVMFVLPVIIAGPQYCTACRTTQQQQLLPQPRCTITITYSHPRASSSSSFQATYQSYCQVTAK
jgi:hypothetical protein